MPKLFSKLIIDFTKPVKTTITAIQNDQNSRYIDVILENKGEVVDLTDCTVKIFVKRPPAKTPCPNLPTDNFIYNIGQITDAVNGRVQFALTTDFLKNPGRLECEISVEKIVKDKSEILTTPIFNILVSESLKSDDAIESTNEYGALVVLYENISDAVLQISSIIDKMGIVGEISQENSINTIFEALEKIITLIKNSSDSGEDFSQVINKINESILEQTNTLNTKIENSTNEILKKFEELPRRYKYSINSR